jgi:hypothetical protein
MLVYYFYKNEPLNLEDVEELAEFNRVYYAEIERQKKKKKNGQRRDNNIIECLSTPTAF